MQWQRGLRNFDSECEILSNVRHRNLVKIVSTCSNLDFTAIVLEYMPNGSLDKRLYSDENSLNLLAPIVHCDLKPANVLLDQDLSAHVRCRFWKCKNVGTRRKHCSNQYSRNYAPALKTRTPNCVRSEKAAMRMSVKFEGISEELQKINRC
ncbi:probable LRR receptor-like serine/threonine-protein kinase At3g47570 [Solanum stenotomum]|uniref:probable LRR receptor-like serine/threonine-protein kinase At3g47570 n=1 Tax=Solanum stenotomum TaxID=172797 RepID=UPI0020D1261C|nr:probable LRR receptor-like serine/threonine-protein kinase At3g47570 [Solanum stenotomum]